MTRRSAQQWRREWRDASSLFSPLGVLAWEVSFQSSSLDTPDRDASILMLLNRQTENTASSRNRIATGWFESDVIFPSVMIMACLSESSAIGPRMNPIRKVMNEKSS